MDFNDLDFDLDDIESITQNVLTQAPKVPQQDRHTEEAVDEVGTSPPVDFDQFDLVQIDDIASEFSMRSDHEDGDDDQSDSAIATTIKAATSRLQPLEPHLALSSRSSAKQSRLQPIGLRSATSAHTDTDRENSKHSTIGDHSQQPRTTSRLDHILNPSLNPTHDKQLSTQYARDRKRPLQPLPQTFHNDDLSYEDYLHNSSSRMGRLQSLNDTNDLSNPLVSLNSTPTSSFSTTPTTRPAHPSTPSNALSEHNRFGQGASRPQSNHHNQFSHRFEPFPHPFDTPSQHTNLTGLPTRYHQYNTINGSMTSFPLLDDSLGTFKPFYEQFLQYSLWALNLNTLNPNHLQPLYQTCLRLKSIPIPVGLEGYMDWSEAGLRQNLPVVNGELQVPLIPGLEEPSLQLLSILTNALVQRGNSHSLILASPEDLPLLCVGSVLGHILFNQNSTKLNAVVIHLSGHVTTNDTLSIQSMCFQLCEQLGISCSIDASSATFHDYAQFITILLRQISTLDITDINTYDAKYNLYEHRYDAGQKKNADPLQHTAPVSSSAASSSGVDSLTAIPIIIILDGFDHFAKSGVSIDDNSNKGVSRQSFLYFLGDLAQTNQAWMHIVAIANSPVAYDYLEKRVKSRFPMQNIFLHNALYQIPPVVKERVDGNLGSRTTRGNKRRSLNTSATTTGTMDDTIDDWLDFTFAPTAVDIFADTGSVLDRLRAVLYSFLALPCESIDNINPPFSPTQSNPSLDPPKLTSLTSHNNTSGQQQPQQPTLGVAKTAAKDQSVLTPTHWDGKVPLSSLPITPRTWSPIDLNRDFTLPHWTQVFYYNTTLWATLQNEAVTESVLTPMLYSGFSLSKAIKMVSAMVTNMITYPTLLSPNVPPVLQCYQQYCEQVDEKRGARYGKYGKFLADKVLRHKNSPNPVESSLQSQQSSSFKQQKNNSQRLSLGSKKIQRYLAGFKPTPVKSHFKYLSSWRGTSAIATLMICPWDVITAFLDVTHQISDYETTLCELHNHLFSRPHTFSTKSITNQTVVQQLINPSELTLGKYRSNGVLMTPTKNKRNTEQDQPQLKSEYAIDLGFIARLLRFFQSNLSNDSFLNHTKVQHETNALSFDAYLTQVLADRERYQQYYLPRVISKGGLVLKDGEDEALAEKKVQLYFPTTLHFFQPGPSSPRPCPFFQILSLCIEPDTELVQAAHQQYQTYRKAQIKQRQNLDNNNNNIPQTPSKQRGKERNKAAISSHNDLSSIFKMYLQSWSSLSIVFPTGRPDYGAIHPVVVSDADNDVYSAYNGVNLMGAVDTRNTPTSSSSAFNNSTNPNSNLTKLSPHSTPRSSQSQRSQSSMGGGSTPTGSQTPHARHGTPMRLHATPLKSTPLAKSSSEFNNPFNNTQSAAEIQEQLAVLHGPQSSMRLPTVSTTLSYFQTDALLNQHLSTLSCHSLGLLAAALRLELRGEAAYSFNKLFEEHTAFLHSWSLNQPNINPLELFSNQESCLELHEQLIIDQLFVYCTKLHVSSAHTRQLNLDLFVSDGDDLESGQQRLAVINKGSQPSQIITVHPMQHQLHTFIKNNNPGANLSPDHQYTTVNRNNNKSNTTNASSSLLHKVKIQCVISRNQFGNFLKEFKAHLNRIRFINPLDYESVPVWVDVLLDTDIKTTSTV